MTPEQVTAWKVALRQRIADNDEILSKVVQTFKDLRQLQDLMEQVALEQAAATERIKESYRELCEMRGDIDNEGL